MTSQSEESEGSCALTNVNVDRKRMEKQKNLSFMADPLNKHVILKDKIVYHTTIVNKLRQKIKDLPEKSSIR